MKCLLIDLALSKYPPYYPQGEGIPTSSALPRAYNVSDLCGTQTGLSWYLQDLGMLPS